ncbi:MAG TPA: hypothetical protein VN253_03005 [Kofleriaceae bacterium]|nr:hypothetical protein [Kofleriaceae bacterium]
MGGRGLELAARARPTFDGSALAFALPDVVRKGDLLLVLVVRNGPVTAPTGWTQVETALGASSLFLDAWARLVDDDEPTAPTWTSASSQELQGQLLVFNSGTPAIVREASAHAAFTATSFPGIPAGDSVQAINLLVAVYSTAAGVSFSHPDFEFIDLYTTAVVSTRTLAVRYRRAGATGLITPGTGVSHPAATGRAFLLVLRERAPITPIDLSDPVPGNIGLLPT